jgi:hypothetical protein
MKLTLLMFIGIAGLLIAIGAIGRAMGWNRPPAQPGDLSDRMRQVVRREVAAARARNFLAKYPWN